MYWPGVLRHPAPSLLIGVECHCVLVDEAFQSGRLACLTLHAQLGWKMGMSQNELNLLLID